MKIKKCQPGFICLDNMAVVLVLFAIAGIGYYFSTRPNKTNSNPNVDVESRESPGYNNRYGGNLGEYFGIGGIPSYPYNNLPLITDPLINPYNPPLRDDRYFVGPSVGPAVGPAMPINVATSSVNTAYRQVGILTPLNETSTDNILPLMGRPLFTRRSKFQYYTISNQHNNVKLPILVKQKNGLSEQGVDELSNGDTVLIEGVNKPYKVTTYEDSTIQYLPFL